MFSLFSLLIVAIVIFAVKADDIRDMNFELYFIKDRYLSTDFDSSFYKALFIQNRTDFSLLHQLLTIQDLDDMSSSRYVINITGPLIFSGLMNTGNIVLVCQAKAYLVSKLDGYSTIEMPDISRFLAGTSITNISNFNDFNQTVLAVYNTNRLVEFDVRLPLQAKATPITFAPSDLSSAVQILDLVYINGGQNFAILSVLNNVESVSIYTQNTKTFLQNLGDQVDDTKRMIYNVELNILLLVKFSSKNILIYECNTFSYVGSINFSLTGLDGTKISFLYSPLGTKILLIISEYKIYTFDLDSKTFIREFLMPAESLEVNWAEGTPYFLSKQLKDTDKFNFRFFRMESSDSRYCHKSCGSSCKSVFKPCYNTWSIVVSLFLSILTVASLAAASYYGMVYVVKHDKTVSVEDEKGDLYELTADGMRPKRSSFSYEPGQFNL